MFNSPYFAAIDLGSNSFHMLIGRMNKGHLEIVDREKEMVQIARGLDNRGKLDSEAKQRALDCLKRFSERLRDIPAEQIRAVGTKTLRSAKNSDAFIKLAQTHLGHPIQIISGYEEARLVYCGLAHTVNNDARQRLVIDIGGGSTEFITGIDTTPNLLESLSLGCVSFTNRFFNNNSEPFSEHMNKAYIAACSEIESIRNTYRKMGWTIAYGTSGTMKAIAELLQQHGASTIEYEGLVQLMQNIMREGGVFDDNIPKLRRDVLPAGIAILKAIFDQLGIKQLHVADASLKEGLIFDTVGRFSKDDIRYITVKSLTKRYHVDKDQANRVSELALSLWQDIEENEAYLAGISRTKILKWAAELHEIGLSISHSSYHKHGFYLLRHSDLAGFGRYEQFILASLVRFQRKKIRSENIDDLGNLTQTAFMSLLLCLRLSIQFNRRRENCVSELHLKRVDDGYHLCIAQSWLELHPLTRASLLKECNQLANIGIDLSLQEHALEDNKKQNTVQDGKRES